MRIAIPHTLGKNEVRRRLKARSGEIAGFIPGGMADVRTEWPSDDRMTMAISAMGQKMGAQIDVEETQLVFVVDLPPALSFVEPMVAAAIREKGMKLLK
ncbi:hypothetical protein ACFO0A_00370 [Novosphingobium tardum]|uniref:Polyhydroxyalkanoic acid system protein n=1 Tax=Novosphingobium tardum TaxID=1538021 RepID=A0ABV8RLD4_9SPHN